MTEAHACLVVQQPNFFGYLEDVVALEERAHAAGALFVVVPEAISLGMFKPPGEYGADIVVAEGQPLGIPLSFGGPYVGLFATRQEHIRQMPGRLVGRTTDADGRTGYVLTLQTREQHIRRERATSNICTNEQLCALAATVYLCALGKQGLRRVAELCYHKAHYAADRIAALPGYSLPLAGAFFQEFVVRCPRPPREVNAALLERGIIGGLDVSERIEDGMLLCVTEMNSRDEIDRLVDALGEIGVMSDGERRNMGSRLSFDRGRPGRTAVTLPDCDVPLADDAAVVAAARRAAAAGDVAAGDRPLLHQPRLPELQRRHRLLPARQLHHEVQPQAARRPGATARLRAGPSACSRSRPSRARWRSCTSCRASWRRSPAWTR